MKTIIFDIGANTGDTFLQQARNGSFVYCFEPTPELINNIKQKGYTNIPTYFLIEKAISDYNGKSVFHVAGQADWGCSSLLDFSNNLDQTWPNRLDLKVTYDVEVLVTRMDTFLKENLDIEHIDYVHIDTQGNDLKVLESFGQKIQIIKSGVVEVPMNEEVKLYKNQHSKKDMLDFLEKNNFKIIDITKQQNEENIFFKNNQ